jgi:hypothetical protein
MLASPSNWDIFEQMGAKSGAYFFRSPRVRGKLFFGIKKARSIPFTTERQRWESVPPEVLEAHRTECRVHRRMLDRNVSQPVLDRPGVDAIIGQLVAAAMPHHVKMYRQGQLGSLADRLHKPVDGIWCEWRAALGREDVASVREFLAKGSQHAQLVASDGMDGWLAILGPTNMQGG